MATWGTPPTFTAGATLGVAAQLNVVRDDLKVIGDPLASYTPVWTTSGTAPSLGNGTVVGAVSQAGKATTIRITLTIGSTTTVGTGNWRFTLPAAPLAGVPWVMQGTIFDASVPTWYPLKWIWDGTIFQPWCDGTVAGGPLRLVASATPITWATGDVISVQGTYEAA